MVQEAGRRCKMEFISRPEDRKPRWIITEGSSEPKLIEEKCEEEEGSGEGVRGGDEGGEKGEKVAYVECNTPHTCTPHTHTPHIHHVHTRQMIIIGGGEPELSCGMAWHG